MIMKRRREAVPMDAVNRLAALLPPLTAEKMRRLHSSIREVRLRANRPVQLVLGDGDCLCDDAIDCDALRRVLAALMDFSMHTREAELSRGFFTLDDGSRAGVCGRMIPARGGGAAMTDVASLCVRIARQKPGCADALMPVLLSGGFVHSMLIVSPPGMGKTTLLRDAARQLSLRGINVAVADERHELAACRKGVPSLDIGPRTDVMDGCAKCDAIGILLRAMAPDAIVTDEIGDRRDARAIADAVRCGSAVIASAHGRSFDDLARRPALAAILETGVFEYAALLGGPPGTVVETRKFVGSRGGGPVWECA